MSLYNYETVGNGFRINNLEITDKKIILCVHDKSTMNICSDLQKEFGGRYPYAYIGTTPWSGSVMCDTPLKKDSEVNLKINKLLLSQGEIGLILYCITDCEGVESEIRNYFEFMKENVPYAKHVIVRINELNTVVCQIGQELGILVLDYDNTENLIEFSRDYIDSVGKPNFFEKSNRERAEWTKFSFYPNKTDKKRVLLVGDSISCGYINFVRQNMDNYIVDLLGTSEGTAHENIYKFLNFILSEFDYDYIHINIGIHVHMVTSKEYEENISKILDYINKISPKTKIIFATTTTVSKRQEKVEKLDTNNFQFGDRVPCSVNIVKTNDFCVYDDVNSHKYIELNDIARKVCKDKHIAIDDLFDVSYKHNPVKNDSVHFRQDGYILLAQSVRDSIISLD